MEPVVLNHADAPVVFGEMVKLAMPVLECFHSDLFHDAHKLARLYCQFHDVKFRLYWNVSSCATYLHTRRCRFQETTMLVTIEISAPDKNGHRTATLLKELDIRWK